MTEEKKKIRGWKKVLIILLCIPIILGTVLLIWLSKKPAVANDYISKVQTGGEIEAKYLSMGSHEVSYLEQDGMHDFKKYEIYYPSNIAAGTEKYPVVIFSNGT